jgi:heat shock protein HslJ
VAGRKFISTSATGHELVSGSTVAIEFGDDGTVNLYAGCNLSQGSEPRWTGSHLSLTSGWTEASCAPALSDEQDWFGKLMQAGVDLELDGDTLTMTSATATVTMIDRRVVDPDRPLEGTDWVIQGYFDTHTWSGTGIAATLHITNGHIDFFDGTNTYSGPQGPNAHVKIGADTVQVRGDFTASSAGCQAGHTCSVDMSVLTHDFDYRITAGSLTITGPDGSGLDFVADTTAPPKANKPQPLSTDHRALALAAAHREANQIAVGGDDQQAAGWPSGISTVTAIVGPGTVADSNTGHTCASGNIITVRLVGAFNTLTPGTPVRPGAPTPDNTVRELDLSVDATTGETCLIGARTEPTPPGPGDTVLYSR